MYFRQFIDSRFWAGWRKLPSPAKGGTLFVFPGADVLVQARLRELGMKVFALFFPQVRQRFIPATNRLSVMPGTDHRTIDVYDLHEVAQLGNGLAF